MIYALNYNGPWLILFSMVRFTLLLYRIKLMTRSIIFMLYYNYNNMSSSSSSSTAMVTKSYKIVQHDCNDILVMIFVSMLFVA